MKVCMYAYANSWFMLWNQLYKAVHKQTSLGEVLEAISEKYAACMHRNFSTLNNQFGCPETNFYIEYLNLKYHMPGGWVVSIISI